MKDKALTKDLYHNLLFEKAGYFKEKIKNKKFAEDNILSRQISFDSGTPYYDTWFLLDKNTFELFIVGSNIDLANKKVGILPKYYEDTLLYLAQLERAVFKLRRKFYEESKQSKSIYDGDILVQISDRIKRKFENE